MEDRFPTNSSILLSGPPGVGKFEYLIARIREDLRLGERVVFVSLALHPNEVRARATTGDTAWTRLGGRSSNSRR